MTDTGAAGVAGAAGSAGNGAGNGSAAGALRVGDDVRIETDGGKTVYSGRVFCFDAVNDVVVLGAFVVWPCLAAARLSHGESTD